MGYECGKGVMLTRAKAGPESNLLTEDYGFLPLMQSSKQDREPVQPACNHRRLIVSPAAQSNASLPI